MTPQRRAERCAEIMWATDAASQHIGLSLDRIGPGTAVMTLVVQPRHLNGHGICHGGIIFALADSAFAFACNSHNRVTVAQENSITYLEPAKADDTLTAHAQEAATTGRSGVYDVTVTTADGRRIALFRGLSRSIKGQHFEE